MTYELILPAFIAGLFTFLAPCTLPLVPGYLGFISGVSLSDFSDSSRVLAARRKVFLNGLLYVLGFSVVFILLGSAISWISGRLLVEYRMWLAVVGGVFVVLFGLFMVQGALVYYQKRWAWLASVHLPFSTWLTQEHRLPSLSVVKPGNLLSSFVFGAAFAVGWTPCVGPVLGAILTLAATEAQVLSGALLLGVFSFGLGLPFLILAGGFSYFSQYMTKISKVLPAISLIGGVFIILLGVLLLTDSLGVWNGFFFNLFDFIDYHRIYEFL